MNETEYHVGSSQGNVFGFREEELAATAALLALADGAGLLTLERFKNSKLRSRREVRATREMTRQARRLKAAMKVFWRMLNAQAQEQIPKG